MCCGPTSGSASRVRVKCRLVQSAVFIDVLLPPRWERVAEVVPGKSKVQCFKRFKELRDLYRSKKGGAAGEE